MISVLALWRYPLKSAQGESLQSVDVDREGVRSDRAWACIDLEDGTMGGAKHPGKWGRLLEWPDLVRVSACPGRPPPSDRQRPSAAPRCPTGQLVGLA